MMTMDEMMDALEDVRERFLDTLDELEDEELLQPGVVGDWSVKDIICHLLAWEAELVKLLWQAKQGQKPTSFLAIVANVDEANARFTETMKDKTLDSALDDYAAVRKQTLRRLEGFTDKDLHDPKRYPWLKNSTLYDIIEGNSFGHEEEHLQEIQAWMERRAG